MAQAFSTEKVGWAKEIGDQVIVWSWGANSYGQLGQGHCDDQLLPRQVKDVNGQDIQTVGGGGGHTFIITNNGVIQGCGSNNKGQLGLGHLKDITTFTILPEFSSTRVTQVAAGWDFSLVLTEQGAVYSCGSNAFGQLGNSSLPQKCSSLCKLDIPNNEQIVCVAAGLRHSVALSENGSIYSWGHAKKGQCGHKRGENAGLKITTPTKVDVPEISGVISQIVAGSYHTAALSNSGEVLVWGCNKYGQTTQSPETTQQVNIPYLVPTDMFKGLKVKSIRSGWTQLIAQTETGHLYSWGRSDYGQLGRAISTGAPFCHKPELIETLTNIEDFQCGSEHALFLSDDQKCYSVGWNEHGLCGTGDEINVTIPRLVEILKDYSVIKLGCGGGHCFAVTINTSEIKDG